MVRAVQYLPPTATHRPIRLVPSVLVRRRPARTQEFPAVHAQLAGRALARSTRTSLHPSGLVTAW